MTELTHWIEKTIIYTIKKYSIKMFSRSTTINYCHQTSENSILCYAYSATIKNNIQWLKKLQLFEKILTNTVKNIMMNLYKNILKWQRLCNFYNNIVNFLTCDRKSKFISRNVLIINKTNIQLMQSMMKFNMSNHWWKYKLK